MPVFSSSADPVGNLKRGGPARGKSPVTPLSLGEIGGWPDDPPLAKRSPEPQSIDHCLGVGEDTPHVQDNSPVR